MAESDLKYSPRNELNELVVCHTKTLPNLLDKHTLLKTGTLTIQPVTPWYNKPMMLSTLIKLKGENVRYAGCHHRDIYKKV